MGIKEATKSIAEVFHQVSGLQNFEERVCSYYCLSTWFLSQVNPFPILNVTGPNGTGKSSLLDAFKRLSYLGYGFTAQEMTAPSFRDELGNAHERTAIIDEADGAKGDIESYLGLRYMRETAVCSKKIPDENGGWKTVHIYIYGPTIVHKRVPFKDPAIDGRSITISTVADYTRQYKRTGDLDAAKLDELLVEQGKLKSLKLPGNIKVPDNLAPRVIDAYRPLIMLASMEQDNEFIDPLWERLTEATLSLKDGQSYEPGPIVVQALISALTKDEELVIKNIKLDGELVKIIQYDFGHNLNSRQIAKILRGYGFELKRIGGPYSVVPDINTLVKVCKVIGIEDDAVDKAAKGIINPWRTE